ncbi:MAG: flagellar protein export ATPase FliI [Rhodocyclales bacterium]|nr:flagellar protein export ATPase FliI [Rhodocyclales bacterium]
MNTQALARYLEQCQVHVSGVQTCQITGRLTRINGLVMEASGLKLPLGASARIQLPGEGMVEAEVVGFAGDRLFMMPAEDVYGLAPGALVLPQEIKTPAPVMGQPRPVRRRAADRTKHLPVGDELLGRVVDGGGKPLDDLGSLRTDQRRSLSSRPMNPLQREPIRHDMDVGIRAINGLLTVGRGQRLGLFAGSGVGKSVLLGMMARYTQADRIVVGLIGERGREVQEFLDQNLGEDGRARSVVVAAPADVSPLLRLQGASYATAIAEHFRDQGHHVLLIMDSLTRYAMAQREIALAIGEPPVTRGYPPSVFARLPQLVERAGNGPAGGGSITAFYTVLTEGDDPQDPIADAARAILDGHIVLSRQLSDAGHYPAIDIEQSISRAMNQLIEPEQFESARQFKQLYTRYQRARDLIAVGAYAPGSDQLLDRAIAIFPRLESFLQQPIAQRANSGASRDQLRALFAS